MGPRGTVQGRQGTRFQQRSVRWMAVLVALALMISGVLHLHAAGYPLATQAGASMHVDGHDHAGAAPSESAQDCADAQAAGHTCCMGTGGCAAWVPVPGTSAWPAQLPAAPRPMAEQVAAGPHPLPLYRPPRLSRDV
jgi:hypothetical protein